MPHPILRLRWFWILAVLALAGLGFLFYIQYTANVEARVRIGHNLDNQFFSYVQIQLDQKKLALSALPQGMACPVSSVIRDRERELFPHEKLFKLSGLYLVADRPGGRVLLYRGLPADGAPLLRAAGEKASPSELQTRRYDPTNGIRSVGFDFALLKIPDDGNAFLSHAAK